MTKIISKQREQIIQWLSFTQKEMKEKAEKGLFLDSDYYELSSDYWMDMRWMKVGFSVDEAELKCFVVVYEWTKQGILNQLNRGFRVGKDNLDNVLFNLDTLFYDIEEGYV